MVALTELPFEIISNIISFVDLEDLPNISLVCRHIRQTVSGNRQLCRTIYHRTLDKPASHVADWEVEVRDLLKLQNLFARQDIDRRAAMSFVYYTVMNLLDGSEAAGARVAMLGAPLPTTTADPLPTCNRGFLVRLFRSRRNFRGSKNREAFLYRSFLFERARGEASRLTFPWPLSPRNIYSLAAAKVYDLREYTVASSFGPFLNDDSLRVDWEKVEACLLVLAHSMKRVYPESYRSPANVWDIPFYTPWPNKCVPLAAKAELTDLEQQDPYGVSGTWLMVVSFVDHPIFIDFNGPTFPGPGQEGHTPDDTPLEPFLDQSKTGRLLMKLFVVRIEHPEEDQEGPAHPMVHFEGRASAVYGAHTMVISSHVVGNVQMTPDGEVIWTICCDLLNDNIPVRAMGVQVGGLRSARGVVGNWYERHFSEIGPCGAAAFWQISNTPDSNPPAVPLPEERKLLLNKHDGWTFKLRLPF